MSPERWQHIKELFHSTLEREPASRAEYLAEVCADDPAARAEIEALIAAHEREGEFLDKAAYQIGAEMLVNGQSGLDDTPGEIGHYRIVATLGEGGMGKVYLAEDTRLRRRVALKILPAEFTRDEERVRRFEREAHAISALNHPNILTIYEIGETDASHFIVTEFVEGVTLREHLRKSPVSVSEALDAALQIAGALASVHAAHVVHRDIKPENVMVRADGYIKVLDFGLAKLAEPSPQIPSSSTKKIANLQVNTTPGLVMGTTGYMSPEQAQGLPVDARTDIWSFGVVLYEMLVGRAPFEGATMGETIAAVLTKEPPPLTREGVGDGVKIPPELEWIVKKALRKDREERYQTIKEMLSDLRGVKQEIELEAKRRTSSQPNAGGDKRTSNGRVGAATSLHTEASATNQTTMVAAPLFQALRHHNKRSTALGLLGIVAILATAAFGVTKFFNRSPAVAPSPAPFQTMKVAKLTSTGRATDAAISPDGRYVVHVVEDAGQQSLWVRQVATTSDVQIVSPSEIAYAGLTFSPDGDYLYYISFDRKSPPALYKMPVLGGAARRIATDLSTPVAISPDGRRIAFGRGHFDSDETAVIIANEDGTDERKIASRKRPDVFAINPGGLAWSPDGQLIVSAAGGVDNDGQYQNVVEIKIADGTVRPLTTQRWFEVGRVAWLTDGNGLVMNARETESSALQIWRLSYPEGEARRVTNDLNTYLGLSLTADSSALVTVQNDIKSNIWTTPSGDSRRAVQITSETGAWSGAYGLSWTPDRRIVYASIESGMWDIWVMDADGRNRKRLTADVRSNYGPSVSSDGRYIVFVSTRAGNPNIWRMDIDGANPKQLTSGAGENFAHVSPDSRWVVYSSVTFGEMRLWKVPIDGGSPVQLTDKLSSWSFVSPDGKQVACIYKETPDTNRIAIIPFDGGAPIKTFDIPPGFSANLVWTPDGRALTYLVNRNGISNIWSQPIEGGAPRQITDFKTDGIFAYDWSRDSKHLACSRGTIASDVVLIRNFK